MSAVAEGADDAQSRKGLSEVAPERASEYQGQEDDEEVIAAKIFQRFTDVNLRLVGDTLSRSERRR